MVGSKNERGGRMMFEKGEATYQYCEENMTREEAIKILKGLRPQPQRCDGKSTTHLIVTEVLNMAIKALEQETCEDAVSRQAVLDLVNSDWEYEGLEVPINCLPSVKPAHKKSRWILIDEESNTWQCLRCKELGKDDLWQLNSGTPKDNKMHYCPYCGAEMESEE